VTHPTGSRFLLNEIVHICIPAQPHGAAGEEMVFEGKVAAATEKTLSVAISLEEQRPSAFSADVVRCVVRKSTRYGVLEFEARGRSQWWEEELMLTVTLLGSPREIQRRDSCRIDCHSEVRYRDLAITAPTWKAAELRDVSLGGATLLVQNDTLNVGRELLLEFVLNDEKFSVAAVVRRIERREARSGHFYALEYLEPDNRQQDHMAKAIMKLQLKLISSRVKID